MSPTDISSPSDRTSCAPIPTARSSATYRPQLGHPVGNFPADEGALQCRPLHRQAGDRRERLGVPLVRAEEEPAVRLGVEALHWRGTQGGATGSSARPVTVNVA